MKGQLKSGCANISIMLMTCFNLSNAYCYSSPYTYGVSFAKRFVIGAAMVENPQI